MAKPLLTFFAILIVSTFLLPLLFMVSTAFQNPGQRTIPGAPVYPASPLTGTYQGESYPIYSVPIDGTTKDLMLVKKGRESSTFVDPADASATPIEWQGHWRTLEQSWTFAPDVSNFERVWTQLDFPRLLFNTAAIATLSTIAAVLSSALVAYGFARFRFPGKNMLFVILIATIILPFQVTLIPTYVIFTWLGWNGTWLPLIIPHLFANAFNVFLLRQYFLSIPRDLDEAAMIDGASPFRILRSVIVPLSIPALVGRVACSTSSSPGTTSSCRCSTWRASRSSSRCRSRSSGSTRCSFPSPRSVQAAALMTMAVPVVVFFLAQRAFMRGVVVTGVEK